MSGLEIVDLSKRYGDIVAVDDISLSVPRGSMIGFLGPNGAGKTTTMRAILGMVKPDSGSIVWNGRLLDHDALTQVGYMPQERGLYARMKAHEQVSYIGQLAGLSRAEADRRADFWLDRVELSDRRDSLVQELSGGNQQRVQLAVSLVHDPDLLVLDEPFAGLDPVAAATMRDIIADRASEGASVLFSSHQLDLVEDLCKDVVIIADGRIRAAGAISDIRSQSPRRRLRVRWAGEVRHFQPVDGTVLEFDGRSVLADVSSDSDVARHMTSASAAGDIVEFGFDPPELGDLFSDLTSREVSS